MTTLDIIKLWHYGKRTSSDESNTICPKAGGVTLDSFDNAISTYIAYHQGLPEEKETLITWLATGLITKETALALIEVLRKPSYVIAVVGFSPVSALFHTLSEYGRVAVVDKADKLIEHRLGVMSYVNSDIFYDDTRLDEEFALSAYQQNADVILAVEQDSNEIACEGAQFAWENGVNLIYRFDDAQLRNRLFSSIKCITQDVSSQLTDFAYVLSYTKQGMIELNLYEEG